MFMKISIITLFPKMISGFFEESIVKRAVEKKLVNIEIINLRDFAVDKYGSVDDKPYGGGAGMLLRVEPIFFALQEVKTPAFVPTIVGTTAGKQNSKIKQRIVITSPKGIVFSQKKAQEYSKLNHLIIIAGHYEGVDERVLNFVDEEISLGDFVLTGGEIAACAISDSVVRLISGVLKRNEAKEKESFFEVFVDQLIEAVGENEILTELKNKNISKVKLLEYPQYTRPEEFQNLKVPEILLSGNHKEIEKWRFKMALAETIKKRKDILV